MSGGVLYLGDIATITGDSERAATLSRCKIGTAAQPGFATILTPELLRMRLAGAWADLSDIDWQVPDSVRITTSAQTIPEAVLLEQAQQAVKSKTVGLDCEIKPLGGADLLAPIGQVSYDVRFPSGIHFIGPVTALVAVSVDHKPYRQVTVKLDVNLFKNVVTTVRPLQNGDMISASDIQLERREIGHSSGFFSELSQAEGMVLKRPVAAGTMLQSSFMAMPQVIKRGSLLSLVARIGSIEVATTGQAMENGSINQIIKVQNLKSKKVVSAKVIDANTAEVFTRP